MSRGRLAWVALLGSLILACGGVLSAAPPPSPPPSPLGLSWRGEPLHLKARHLSVDLVERLASLEGEVELRRSDATLRCPRVKVRFDAQGQVLHAQGEGGVSLESRGLKAEAAEASFDVAGQRVLLTGGVRLVRDGLRLSAARASLDLARQQLDLSEVDGAVSSPASSATAPASAPAPAPPASSTP